MSAIRTAHLAGLLSMLLFIQDVAAANWGSVIAGRNETIEIDKASIAPASGGATAWSRIRLEREVIDVGGGYDAIRAQNLYDCANRRFTTLRRAYYKGENLVREELVARHRANVVVIGSIDERLFNLACLGARPADSVAESDAARKREAAGRAADAGERPAPMHADMRSAADDNVLPRVIPVADIAAADKPKLIVLPPIDKAAAAQAAAAQGGVGRAGAASPQKAPVEKPAMVPSPPAITPGVRPEGRPGQVAEVEGQDERRRRELHYATSGPRKVAKKKAPEEPPSHAESQNPAASLHKHWSYEGETGPANWARLRADYASCASGKRQSPIDIREGVKVSLEAIKFDYKLTRFRIIDSGHTVQVNVGEGSGLSVMGKRYELLQFHFHRPAEEKVNGKVYDMSIHLVHRNDEGQLAVVAVLLERGGEHPLIQTLLNNLPLEQNSEVAPEEAIDLGKLLPESLAYWTYMGSLTTPPCTEGVLWMVLKQPAQLAPDQVAIFSRVFRNNARPVQSLNGRLIKETR